MKDTQHYDDRAFAFLDVLGFKDILKIMDRNPDLFEKVKAAIEYTLRLEVNNLAIIEGRRQSKCALTRLSALEKWASFDFLQLTSGNLT